MLLKDYTMEIFNSKCQPGAMGVHCFAHLKQDVSPALPFLNAVLGGHEYFKDPPAVTFKVHGKLITVHGKKIAVNALKDEEEAQKIVEWLVREINDAWNLREEIEPKYDGVPRPNMVEILKRLPKTNCRKCGEPTCLVFATRLAEGAKGMESCPPITAENKKQVEEYLSQFHLNV
jgi:ArsR family metal-binding transcriptional regulator